MSGPARAVILDAVGKTVERCSVLGEWLFWAQVDDPDMAAVVQAGVDAVSHLYDSLRRAQGRAADLWTPDGRTQLDELLVVDDDLGAGVEAIVMAAAAIPRVIGRAGPLLDEPSREPRAFAAHLLRCLTASDGDDGRVLADVPRDRQNPVRLTWRQWLAYRRYVSTVLTDPLERFAATGLTGHLPERSWGVQPDPPGPDF